MKQNFLIHLVTELWSTASSPFAQQISWSIWLLYCDQLHLHLLHNKFLDPSGYWTVINCIFSFCTTNFLIHLVTELWSTASSPFAQQISWSIWLLNCDQLHLHLLHNKFLDPSGYWTVINCTFTFCTTNFLIHLVTELWSTAPSPFAQQISWTIWLLNCDQLHLHLLHNIFLDPSGYCTVINCIFTFCTTNFLNHLVTELWSTASSPFAQHISWSIWLLYCDQLHLHLLHNKFLEPSGYWTMINCIFSFCTTYFLIHLVTELWSTASSPFAQQISWSIWLLYCDQLHLHLLHNKGFWLLLQSYSLVWTCKE